jgi:hypothetical protein
MKSKLFVALLLSVALFSCRPKVIYVDRPVSQPAGTGQSSNNDNQTYQPPAGAAYSNPPQNNNDQQYNNAGQQPNNNNSQQQYNSNQNVQESDQQYYANQQQVNYGSSSYQTFYDELSPYGSWVNYQGYGYVWSPAQGQGFTPYATNGYWAYSDYGMTWVSNYNWGWAPFHYGSWTLDPYYGWLWIPGNVWAPAHVVWGQYNGYYGWAPMGPNYYEGYRPAEAYWNFVPQQHIVDHDFHNYMQSGTNNTVIVNHNVSNVTIINNTNTYNNAVFNAGPHQAEIETATGHSIQPMSISQTNKPVPASQRVNGNSISVYRPAISQTTATTASPAHVVPLDNVKTVNATAIHGSLPRPASPATPKSENLQVNPALRNNEHPMPTQPVQLRPAPVQERPAPSQPVQERPVQPQPRSQAPAQQNQYQNQNRPAPKPRQQPKPKLQPPPKPAEKRQ